MSSLSTSATGLKSIHVYVDDYRRKIRLGRRAHTAALSIKERVDALVAARELGTRDLDAERWCRRLSRKLRERIERTGLLPPREDVTIQILVDRYIAAHKNVKKTTFDARSPALKSLLGYFGGKRAVRSVSPADAEAWRASFKNLSTATIAKRIIVARSVFRCAIKWKMIEDTPFADIHAGSQENADRLRFIDEVTSYAVVRACHDYEWKAIFVLARWGGLRIPSEIRTLRWSDIQWEQSRFRIISPKTEHHPGQGDRLCPLFPEVEKALSKLWAVTERGTEYVFSSCCRSAPNLRKHLMDTMRRHGIERWPKLFQNLRSTRETELCQKYPLYMVCRWIGNSPQIAEKHYLQLPDESFGRVVNPTPTKKSSAEPTASDVAIEPLRMKGDAAAQFLGITEGEFSEVCHKGLIRHVKDNEAGPALYPTVELRRFVEHQMAEQFSRQGPLSTLSKPNTPPPG